MPEPRDTPAPDNTDGQVVDAGAPPVDPAEGGVKPPEAGEDQKPEGGDKPPVDPAEGGVKPPEAGENQKPEGDDKPNEGPPEEYEAFKFAEGVVPPEGEVDKFKTLAKELGLTQDAAQKLVDYQIELNEGLVRDETAQRVQWREEVSKDPKWQENRVLAGKAIDKFADDEAKDLLTSENSWLSDHPALLRLFANIGRQMAAEDDMLGDKGQGSKKDIPLANLMYPGMN